MTADAPRRPSWAAGVLLAVASTTFLVAVTRHIPPGSGERALDAFGYALLVAAGAVAGGARHRPRVAVAGAVAVLAAYALRGYAGGPVFAVGWYALVELRRRTDRRTALAGAGLLCAVLVGVAVAVERRVTVVSVVFVGWSAAAVLLGDVLENRRRHVDAEARRRVAEDRLRIARDLHDSVAHAMAIITVQAGAAEHVVDRKPEAAKEALAAIRKAGGDVLDELAAMLDVLRAGEAADRAPTPGLDRVGDLVATGRANGLDVTLAVDGPVDAVSPAVGTAAYRIVQESLTNVIRHAPGAAVAVTVRAEEGGGLAVEVRDGGPGRAAAGGGGRAATGAAAGATGAGAGSASSAGTGVGLRGMRERAESTGGSVEAGPDGHGFVVRATWEGRT